MAREYQIKAVFLFNFTQFVDWPEDAFEDPETPLIIGVYGNDPFGSHLDQTVTGESIHGHPLLVRRFASFDDIEKCHILFIADADRQQIRRVLERVRSKPILTVSDADSFARMGGMIRFYNEGGRIRFRINVEPVNESGLTISSKLLRLAEVISSKPE